MNFEALNYVPTPIVVLERAFDGAFVYSWMNKAAKIFSGLGLEDIYQKSPRQVFPGRAGEQLARRQ